MKAKLIAVFLSFFILSFPLCASIATPGSPTNQSLDANKINLNKVDSVVLAGSFKGIGKKRAEAIIAYRDAHQGFKSLDELAKVKGIGSHFVSANIEQLKQVYAVQ